MIDASEKRNRQLNFCGKRSNKDVIIIKPLIKALFLMQIALFLGANAF